MGKNEHCSKTFDDIAVFVFIVNDDHLDNPNFSFDLYSS